MTYTSPALKRLLFIGNLSIFMIGLGFAVRANIAADLQNDIFNHLDLARSAAMVGEAGELEHAAALLHPKMGAPLRHAVERGAALVPSSKKIGGMGATLDVPLGHKDAAYVRSHFDAVEVRVPDAPRAGEIVVAIAVTDSGRPLPRVGGLTTDAAEGKDGLR